MPVHLDIPAAWRGDELFTRDDALLQLGVDDVADLNAALERSSAVPLEEIAPSEFPLPGLGPKLQALSDALERRTGVVRVLGLPVDEYDEPQLARLFWGLCRHLGTPVSQSAAGERLFHVRDEGFAPSDARARGPNSKRTLAFHTDRCDVIAFLCVRQARSGGENQLISSVTLYNEILARRPDLLAVLMEPYYYQRHNVDSGNELAWCRQPVFSFQEGHFAGSLLRVLIERAYQSPELPDMTDLQREALDYLEEVAEEDALRVTFRQQPGDILLVNNWVTLHRRLEFEDEPDPALRRHLLRLWLSVPNSRPLDPLFKDNYGATAAGALRGGMKPRS